MSKLLLDEPPLVLQRSLAALLGLNEAIVLQQLHYWTTNFEADENGNVWVIKNRNELGKEFPFWSPKTIQRAISSLQKNKIIAVEQPKNWDRTSRYLIKYGQLQEFSDLMHQVKMTSCKESEWPHASGQNDLIRSGQNDLMSLENKNTTTAPDQQSKNNLTPSGHQHDFDYLSWSPSDREINYLKKACGIDLDKTVLDKFRLYRSEERRVGKELRSRRLP